MNVKDLPQSIIADADYYVDMDSDDYGQRTYIVKGKNLATHKVAGFFTVSVSLKND